MPKKTRKYKGGEPCADTIQCNTITNPFLKSICTQMSGNKRGIENMLNKGYQKQKTTDLMNAINKYDSLVKDCDNKIKYINTSNQEPENNSMINNVPEQTKNIDTPVINNSDNVDNMSNQDKPDICMRMKEGITIITEATDWDVLKTSLKQHNDCKTKIIRIIQYSPKFKEKIDELKTQNYKHVKFQEVLTGGTRRRRKNRKQNKRKKTKKNK